MCLTTNDPTKKIAEKNIPCYKHGDVYLYGAFGPKFYPRFRYLKYKKTGEEEIVPYMSVVNKGYYIVDIGYHSFNNIESCKGARALGDETGLFIIPKKAEYIEGQWDDSLMENRVSTHLIYLGRNTKFNRWIGKIFYGVSFDK